MTTEPTTAAAALDRARALLEPASRSRPLNEAGYLDLLDIPPESTGVAQDLMATRLVPAIYERYWRPALGRVVKGITGPGMAEEIRIARLLLGLGEGDIVLDLACGPGNFSREFAHAVGDLGLVVGVDASPTMLARGSAELRGAGMENVVLIRADANALPFRDHSFDRACCFAALHLFADPLAALDEIRRVLRPGRREVTLRPLKPLIERASGMRIFEADEVADALAHRGFTEIHRRLSGMVQFVGARRP